MKKANSVDNIYSVR